MERAAKEDPSCYASRAQQLVLGRIGEFPIDILLKRNFAGELAVVQSSPAFYSYLIGGTKIDLVFDPLSTAEGREFVTIEGGKQVLVDTLKNIASNKLAASASRSEPKDLVDLYFISKELWSENREESLRACYEMARRKEALLDDPATAAYQVELLYNRVLAQKEKVLPPLKSPIDWSSFQETLRSIIDTIYRMEKW